MPGYLAILVLMGSVASSDDRLPLPLSRGVLVDWSGSDGQGHLIFKTPENDTHRCAFSSKTFFERAQRRTRMSQIASGTPLEVLSERTPEPPRCRALIVRVIDPTLAATTNAVLRQRRPVYAPPESQIIQRGNLLISGIVVRVDEPYFWVRTRHGESYTLKLRQDTRLMSAGLSVDRSEIPMNTPLQIRAGKGLEGETEVYSVAWGQILRPEKTISNGK